MQRFDRIVAVLAVMLMSGCSAKKEEKPAPIEAIALDCRGDMIAGEKREPVSYLIKVMPGNEFQRSLYYYSGEQKRYVSPCEDPGFSCSLETGKDLISEVGEMNLNSGIVRRITEINRNTGAMRTQLFSGPSLPVLTQFEGTCQKGDLPVEEPKKF